MALDYDQVTVTTVATLLAASTSSNATNPTWATINNPNATGIVIGGSGVTATTGIPLPQNGTVSLCLPPGGNDLYGITASSSSAVNVLIANGTGD